MNNKALIINWHTTFKRLPTLLCGEGKAKGAEEGAAVEDGGEQSGAASGPWQLGETAHTR